MDGIVTPLRRVAGSAPPRSPWTSPILQMCVLAAALVAVIVVSLAVFGTHSGDINEYHQYAVAFWQGPLRFSALPREYPPLSMVIFTLTLLPPLANYQLVFMAWMAIFVLAGYALIARFSGWRSALLYAVYLLLGTAGALLSHFDIAPALTTLGALWLAQQRRFTGAYVLLAVGTLLKLYPAFLVPILLIEEWRTVSSSGGPLTPRDLMRGEVLRPLLRGIGVFVGVVAAGFLVALLINSTAALALFTYAGNRPLQLESTPASLLWLGTFFGSPAYENHSFASYNYVGASDGFLKLASAVALAAGCLWVYWRQAQGRLSLGRATLACVAVVIATNKIFSPQYLIWILPIVAIVEGFDALWLAISALTAVIFPILYRLHPLGLAPYSWQFMLVVAIRNALLVVVTLRVILSRDAAAAPSTQQTPAAHPVPVAST